MNIIPSSSCFLNDVLYVQDLIMKLFYSPKILEKFWDSTSLLYWVVLKYHLKRLHASFLLYFSLAY